jgi:hypothetical protein
MLTVLHLSAATVNRLEPRWPVEAPVVLGHHGDRAGIRYRGGTKKWRLYAQAFALVGVRRIDHEQFRRIFATYGHGVSAALTCSCDQP